MSTNLENQMDEDTRQAFEEVGRQQHGELAIPDEWVQREEVDEKPDFPEPPELADTEVTLPGGVFTPQGQRLRRVEIRELNGHDEEHLSRAKTVGEFKRRVVECGVVKIEGHDPEPLLPEMLMGDRDFLIVAIRKATFGKTLDLTLNCPNCREQQEIEYDFDKDIPVRELDEEGTSIFSIELKSGRVARAALPQAQDEDAVLKAATNDNVTMAETNTLMLQQVLQDIDGMPVTAREEVLRLSMADRRTILNDLHERRIGPQFEEVTYACARCDVEMPIAISVFEMFR